MSAHLRERKREEKTKHAGQLSTRDTSTGEREGRATETVQGDVETELRETRRVGLNDEYHDYGE